MKVCHVTSAHNSNDVRIFHKECASLAKAGYETYLVAAGESRVEKGVHVIGIGPAPSKRLERMTRFAKAIYIKALETDADIYHLHDPELIPYGLKLKKHGKIVIFDSHENTLEQMEDKRWIPHLLRKLVSNLYKHYASSVFSKFDALISVTPHIIRQLHEINSNVYMITNYPILETAEADEKPSTGVFSLCFTGGIDRQWSHEHIIEAIASFDNMRYLLCGKAGEGYMAELKVLQGWSKVDYKGILPHSEAKLLQRSADVGMALLRPSKNTHGTEGTIGNTKLFEYMMAGLPIICTDFELWKDIIEKYDCGICVNLDDKDALHDALKALQSEPARAKQMGLNGRRAVEQEFNWKTQEIKLKELYTSLIGTQ